MNIFKKLNRKNIEIAVCLALISSIILSFAHFDAACEDLRKSVLRLHIIANSDTAADQQVKLKIRDEILKNSKTLFKDCEDLDSAILSAKTNIEDINEIANRVLLENGFSYTAKARIGDSYFETREYDDFTLPAGTYKSLIVDLGEAEGKNWWCVVFPKVCVGASDDKDSLSESAAEESTKIAESKQEYKVKFKIVEWYESFKKKLKKK